MRLNFWVIAFGTALVHRFVALLESWRRRCKESELEPWYLAVRAVTEDPTQGRQDLPCEILPHLLYGDKRCALDTFLLQALGVTHVLNVAGAAGDQRLLADYPHFGIKYIQLDGEDDEEYPMLANHFSQARTFIREALHVGGKCLVHCVAGINRSGVLVAAELMMHERLPVLEAVQRCKDARGRFLCNEGFQKQLVRLAQQEGLLGPKPSFPHSDDPKLPPKRLGVNKQAREAFHRRLF